MQVRGLGGGVRALLGNRVNAEGLSLEQSVHECCKKNEHLHAVWAKPDVLV